MEIRPVFAMLLRPRKRNDAKACNRGRISRTPVRKQLLEDAVHNRLLDRFASIVKRTKQKPSMVY